MKRSCAIAVFAALLAFLPTRVNSRAEVAEATCRTYFEHPYIVTGQPFRSILTGDEVAEFHTTLFSGTTYRIAVGNAASSKVVFSVYDIDHNLLFSSKDYGNAPYWDFSVDGYMECIVEARLDDSEAQSGFVTVMTGFKLNESAL